MVWTTSYKANTQFPHKSKSTCYDPADVCSELVLLSVSTFMA